MPSTHKLAVILFADIEGYTSMMQAMAGAAKGIRDVSRAYGTCLYL